MLYELLLDTNKLGTVGGKHFGIKSQHDAVDPITGKDIDINIFSV